MKTPVGPIRTRAGLISRWRTMSLLAVRMMLHDKLKMAGTMTGVIFAVVLANQQLGTFGGLLQKNTMFADNAACDIWIAPPETRTLQPGKLLGISTLMQARTTPGVAWAEPLAYGAGTVTRADGGSEQVSIVGARMPRLAGGPWNIVQGDPRVLSEPDTMFFEDSQRDKLGGMNLGSVRELNGHRVVAGGFTWGLLPFGPAYAFAEYDTARNLLRIPEDQTSFVLVGVEPGADVQAVQAALRQRIPDATVFTKSEFQASIVNYLLTETAIGISFGVSTAFGIIVGFVIVALTMFSAVIDNVREFGTLKAVGTTTWDLSKLLITQSVLYALFGSLVGLFLVTRMSEGIRSPELALVLPPVMYVGTTVFMVLLCIVASSLALIRIRSVEPGMVFR